MSGPNACAYTAIPTSTWDGQVICTGGASASAPSVTPPPPVTSGQIIYTETLVATAGASTVVYGCTSTTVRYDIDPYPFTTCLGDMTQLTTLFAPTSTIATPTSTTTTPTTTTPYAPLPTCTNDAMYGDSGDCRINCVPGVCQKIDGVKGVNYQVWKCTCIS